MYRRKEAHGLIRESIVFLSSDQALCMYYNSVAIIITK